MTYVASLAVAEEVVQETWISLLQSLDRFEGRCSLKTWIFRNPTNRAKARGVREARKARRSPHCSVWTTLPTSRRLIQPRRSNQPAMDQTAELGKSIPEERGWLAQETRIYIQQAVVGCHQPSAP